LTDDQIAALKEPGGTLRMEVFDDIERAVLRYADLLTTRPANVTQADLDELGRHLTEEQVIELVLAVATANWTNRVNEGLRTPL
jgi:alkylhydroperoxidase family enzyme